MKVLTQEEINAVQEFPTEKKTVYVRVGWDVIWCRLYIPQKEGKLPERKIPEGKLPERKIPLVILCHELGMTHLSMEPYARSIAEKGCASLIFDFRNSSLSGKSGNEIQDMSPLTEAQDVESVYRSALEWDFVDPERIILLGACQGAAAVLLALQKGMDLPHALILLYPAFNIPDLVHEAFPAREEITDVWNIAGVMDVGRKYAEDMYDADLYRGLEKVTVPVMILHGSRDDIVPARYFERAEKMLPRAERFVIPGAAHGFLDGYYSDAMQYICSALIELSML